MRALAALPLLLALVAGCATGPDPVGEVRAKAWDRTLRQTRAVALGSDRLRVEVSTPLVGDLSAMEFAALARASGEATAAGADRFAIVYLDYDESSLPSFLAPQIRMPSEEWIGSYEDLLRARDRADIGGALDERYGYRTMVMIVRLLDAGEAANEPAFDADETYDAMLRERVEREDIRPRRRLALPFGS